VISIFVLFGEFVDIRKDYDRAKKGRLSAAGDLHNDAAVIS